jgi:catechol 2,3-dioxygenase-like lactoylglutathione lyase family enzyme
MIKKLHHNAYRCRDSEETRRFYEDFLGLPLCEALEISETKTGRKAEVLHTFYQLDDGSFLAFFDAPDEPFEFKQQHDYDRAAGIETRGITDHGFIHSIYLRDPNGYVIELTAKVKGHAEALDPRQNHARDKLARWTARRQAG